jgi:hypothetical protein
MPFLRHLTNKFLFLIFLFSFLQKSFAIDNDVDERSAVIAPRNDTFYKQNRTRQFVSFYGERETNERRKQYVISGEYFYKSNKIIAETNIKQDVVKEEDTKTKEFEGTRRLFEFIASGKFIINDTNNYALIYNRTRHDHIGGISEKADNVDDINTIAGFGRMFFDDMLELDAGIGYYENEIEGYNFSFSPSFRAEFNLSKNFRFYQRGYYFYSDVVQSYYLKTRISYRLEKNYSIQIGHDFDQRKYVGPISTSKNAAILPINKARRTLTLGIRYDF